MVTQRILTMAGRPEAVVSIDLIGDLRMRRLNRQYRGNDAATDVLAFAMQEAEGPPSPLLGDVVISLHTAKRQAVQCRIPLGHEVAKLVIHGILHLLGYDHERSERDARRMRRREQTIFQSLLPLPKLVATRKNRHDSVTGPN
ncbi:MAG: rRNA maturation RNase YbeY [Nitrospiraceae bacterium]